MIHIGGFKPTARELRPVLKAWPGVRSWANLGVIWMGAVAIVTIILAAAVDPSVGYWIMGCQIALIYGVILLGFFVQKRIARLGAAAPLMGLDCEWCIDERGIELTTTLSKNFVDWQAIVRVVEEKDRLIFAVTLPLNYVLPKRAVTNEQIAALKALVADVTASGRLGRGVD